MCAFKKLVKSLDSILRICNNFAIKRLSPHCGGGQKMAERLSTSARTAWRTSPGQVTPLCAKVCTIRVHCPLSLKLLLFRELTPCKLTSARTHARPRTHALTRTRAQRRTRTPCSLLQKAEFALNSTAHCAVLGKRS